MHEIILNTLPLIKNFFSNVNTLRITATNMQKSYYMKLIKLVLLINLSSIRLILKCKYNVHKR